MVIALTVLAYLIIGIVVTGLCIRFDLMPPKDEAIVLGLLGWPFILLMAIIFGIVTILISIGDPILWLVKRIAGYKDSSSD